LVIIGYAIYDYVTTKTVDPAAIVAAVVFIGVGIGVAYFGKRYVD
jgi:hypothetical protein